MKHTLHRVLISLASNHEAGKNLAEARSRLPEILSGLRFSCTISTEPIHSPLPYPYLNQLAMAETSLSVDDLTQALKDIETALGRTDTCRRQGLVPIDLDLLRYDDYRYHLRDWSRPYVQRLLPSLPQP